MFVSLKVYRNPKHRLLKRINSKQPGVFVHLRCFAGDISEYFDFGTCLPGGDSPANSGFMRDENSGGREMMRMNQDLGCPENSLLSVNLMGPYFMQDEICSSYWSGGVSPG